MQLVPDLLGSPIAEQDSTMLTKAFFESPELKTLTQPGTKFLVVGRRGTGKSALFIRLNNYYSTQGKTLTISIAPSEDALTAIRFRCEKIARDYKQLRRISRLIWSYSILNETAMQLATNYKTKRFSDRTVLSQLPQAWSIKGKATIIDRMLSLLETIQPQVSSDPKEAFIFLQKELRSDELKDELERIIEKSGVQVTILIDRMDEGWDEDSASVGFLAGLLVALEPINQLHNCRVISFLRDNIFRAIHQTDPEGPRILESGHIRLRWDTETLFSMICQRIKVRFNSTEESNHKLWNLLADRGIENRNGFLTCLGHTLYRPRDIIHLLNQSAFEGMKKRQTKIISDDVLTASTSISEARLNDLSLEYRNIFPAIGWLTQAFRQRPNIFSVQGAEQFLAEASLDSADAQQVQDLRLLPTTNDRLRLLYRVGFIGILNKDVNRFVFCHDGSSGENFESIEPTDFRIMIHPCYWKALELEIDKKLSIEEASQQIHDEYEIKTSENPYYRTKAILQQLSEIEKIKDGNATSSAFEDWAYKTLGFLTAGKITNLDLRPNKNSPLRRDIVGTIVASNGFWARVNADYGVREVIFEVKNYSDLGSEDFQQMNSYLGDEYGKLGFFITKKDSDDLRPSEADQIRNYSGKSERNCMIVISKKSLLRYLNKLRNPDRHTYIDEQLGKVLDFYIRQVYQR